VPRAGIAGLCELLLFASLFNVSVFAASPSCKLKLAHKTQPKLPKNLRGVRSELMVRVEVAADGRITSADVIQGTGNREVDAAVVKAMREEWRYKPLRDCATAEEAITVKLEYHDKVGP
jgi:TonB family protein